jgi:hypothetical protein
MDTIVGASPGPTRRTVRVWRCLAHFSHPNPSGQKRSTLRLVPASDQQGRPQQDQRSDPPMAAAPVDRAHLRRAGTTDQSGCARQDAVPRGVLPLRAVPAPVSHQCPPEAVDPQEIQAVAHHPQGRGLLATRHQPVPSALRPLGMGARFLVDKMTRARVTRDCHAGSVGSGG